MTYPVALPPLQTNWTEPFAEQTLKGLFAAPWLEPPTAAEATALVNLAGELLPAHDDLTGALGCLLSVRASCLRAASARDPGTIRRHYAEALAGCEAAIDRLHHAVGGTTGAIVAWAQAVHTLIEAQLALPAEPDKSATLARHALSQLQPLHDPLCAGAAADANAAARLATEPTAIQSRLAALPAAIRYEVTQIHDKITFFETLLNQRLAGVHLRHVRALQAGLLWTVLHVGLMAALPLNGFFRPDIAWSVPFVIAVPVLWWWTWGRPYREGLTFFAWHRVKKARSLGDFADAAARRPAPQVDYRSKVHPLLETGRRDQEQLLAFCLFSQPTGTADLTEAEAVVAETSPDHRDDWLVELDDRHPWPLANLLASDLGRLTRATRIWFGWSPH